MSRTLRASSAAALLAAATVTAQSSRVHELRLTPAGVHWGYYDARLKPILRVAQGARVRVEAMVAGGLQRLRLAGATEAEIPDSLKAVEREVTERGPGAHPMSGPIFVEGAEPDSVALGDVLVEDVDADTPASFEMLADTPGTYPLILLSENRRLGTLEIR